MHTKKIVSSRWSLIVCVVALFATVSFTLWNTEVAVSAQVPKGDHGAAEMEYQTRVLKLSNIVHKRAYHHQRYPRKY